MIWPVGVPDIPMAHCGICNSSYPASHYHRCCGQGEDPSLMGDRTCSRHGARCSQGFCHPCGDAQLRDMGTLRTEIVYLQARLALLEAVRVAAANLQGWWDAPSGLEHAALGSWPIAEEAALRAALAAAKEGKG